MIRVVVCISLVWCLALTSRASDWQLIASELPENCFADREVSCALQVTSADAKSVRLHWQVTFERRLWRRGSLRVTTKANAPTDVAFEYRAPPTSAGVIAGGKLQIRLIDEQDQELLQRDFPIWVFPENPFDTEFGWLKTIPIDFVDPDQQLQKSLRELDFPGRHEVSKFEPSRVLIVAEHANLDDKVKEQIDQAMRRGHRVLCLACNNADLRLARPAKWAERNEVPGVHARNIDFVRQIDPRLSSTQIAVLSRFQLDIGLDDRVAMMIRRAKPGWTFLEYGLEVPKNPWHTAGSAWSASSDNPRPEFLYCGLDLMTQWSESPTPRYVLAHLLARICSEPEHNPIAKDLP